MRAISLPFWLSGPELSKLRAAAVAYWAAVEGWIRWPLGQFDPLTARLPIVDLIAWQRDIRRLPGEPEDLYRKRVAFALVCAQDAGQKTGFARIFERLGIGYVETDERVDPVDWDVIILRLSDSQLASNATLIDLIIRTYGRTCRRYQLQVISPIAVTVSADAQGHVYSYHVAKL